MDFIISQIFDQILYIPLFNFLVILYKYITFNDFGVAIIILTFIIRLILSPLSLKSLKSQKYLTEIQPKIKEIQEKFKSDKIRQNQALLDLYRKYNINPFSGCFPVLIQLPFLIALYKISITGFNESSMANIYSFIKKPDFLNSISFGFIDLTKRSVFLSIIAGAVQFFQSKFSFKKQTILYQKTSQKGDYFSLNQQLLYFIPIITIIISLSFPAGLPLYWIATTIFSILEQVYLNKFIPEIQLQLQKDERRINKKNSRNHD